MAGFKFRILLDSKDPSEVFRDIVIADSENLERLYQICIKSVGFNEKQMASFYLSDHHWNKGQEITLLDMGWQEIDQSNAENSNEILIMSQVKIADIIKKLNQRLILVHDFIRMWIFLIELVEITEDTPKEPVISLSLGEAPKENTKKNEWDEALYFDTENIKDTNSFNEFIEDDFEELDEFNEFDDFDHSYFDAYDDSQDY